jgi:hypothetical protein
LTVVHIDALRENRYDDTGTVNRFAITSVAASTTSSTLISRRQRTEKGQGNCLPSKGVRQGEQGKAL